MLPFTHVSQEYVKKRNGQIKKDKRSCETSSHITYRY